MNPELRPAPSNAVRPIAIPEDLARELPCWLVEWVEEASRETELLLANGACGVAAGRCRLLVHFIEAAREWLDGEIDVTVAAQVSGCCEETVRRKVREGVLPDRRVGSKGRHRVRRGDLSALGRGYDPAVDAVRLTATREAR